MGIDHRIEVSHFAAEHLVSEIGTCIHYKGSAGRLNQYARPKAFIFFIRGGTYPAVAADHGYTAAGACAEKSDLEGGKRQRVSVYWFNSLLVNWWGTLL